MRPIHVSKSGSQKQSELVLQLFYNTFEKRDLLASTCLGRQWNQRQDLVSG